MKKALKIIGLLLVILLSIVAIINVHTWICSGKQNVRINTASKIYNNSDLYVSIAAQKDNVDIESKTELKLTDSNGKRIKSAKITYENSNSAIISIPNVKPGSYYIEAKVSSKVGKDKIKKGIVINDLKSENTTITFDKGIYKPGDTVNYRALITKKNTDTPVQEDVNVCIYDGNDNKVYNENFKTSEYGIMGGRFTLADEVNSGLYKLVVKSANNEETKQFKVNPYVTPKYEVKVDYDKENYSVGDAAKITINASYFFGEPVQNADLKVYIDNQQIVTLKTNNEGKASLEYAIDKAKKYNVKVEAVDSSNYYIEEESSFISGKDLFDIQLLPEYGTLANGKNNDVYVFTSNNDGTPLKTYITISSDNYTKQIATDENGIGKFTVDVNVSNNTQNTNTMKNNKYYEVDEYNNNTKISLNKVFSVKAQDMEGTKVSKDISLGVENKSLLLSTDKVKYNQGEDIGIKIQSNSENSRNVYFLKNNKLLKMISTDSSQSSINLGDEYGLIDVLVTENSGDTTSKYFYANNYNNKSFKKTIFIKPKKELKINIGTDKQEYKPGEDIAISFDAKNEANAGIDTALLVSMLDNSILNLANNDLSIDNIKLALQDISFSDELDAASLYSCIVNDSSEQVMMALMLKQKNRDISVSEQVFNNRTEKEKAEVLSILAIIGIGIIVIIMLSIKFKVVRRVVKHLLNFVVLDFLLASIPALIIEEYFWRVSYSIWAFIITTILGLAGYILWISKLEKKITRTTISLAIMGALCIAFAIFMESSIISPTVTFIILCVLAVAILIGAIIMKITENKRKTKKMQKVLDEFLYIVKFIGELVLSVVIGQIIESIIDIRDISLPITVILIYVFNYLLNIRDKKKNKRNSTMRYIITIVISVITTIAVLGIGVLVYNGAAGTVKRANLSSVEDNVGPDVSLNGGVIPTPNLSASAGTQSKSSIWDAAESLMSKGNTNSSEDLNSARQNVYEEDLEVAKTQELETTSGDNKEDNVRNVFLESMCFVPELIANNGNANINMKLSDNITTWTIQAVGNTKDGRIGYGSIDNVRVFKDFFVDFELPKNMIETDNIAIPVTVYNYTDDAISTTIKVKEEDWFVLNNNDIDVNVDAKSTNMVYVPIKVLKAGNNKFRAEISSNKMTDIVEKECTVSPKGYKVEKVISTGRLEDDINEDVLLLDEIVENTANVKVKIYPNAMSQTIEGMENIFRMPTGCFEQISSSLYPNILALKYLEDNGIVNEEVRQKALNYISSGYQKLLTYEVKGESGGYSLYGHSPAETVLTAYGLMEISDLSKVYNVDNSVIEKMTEFLYKKQNSNGTFTITGHHSGGAGSSDDLALNAYITWALSESNPKEEKLKKSVDYLKGKLDKIDDNYTLALVANTLANVNDKELNDVLKRLVSNVKVNGKKYYLTTNVVDYYGSRYNGQTIQTVALTSMALSKGSYNPETNKELINYLIGEKDTYGTWHSTQATILALKAINTNNDKGKLENQTLKVRFNSEEQRAEIKDNPIGLYEFNYKNVNKENKLNIDIEKGNAYYEVVEEYYIPFEKVDTSNDKIEVKVDGNFELNVNDILKSNVQLINKSGNNIENGMVTVSIPQGFTVVEESLSKLESKGIIEKYEMTYNKVNIYLRKFDTNQIVNLEVNFRASYPVEITGMDVRAYDYYNPEIEGKTMPVEIKVR